MAERQMPHPYADNPHQCRTVHRVYPTGNFTAETGRRGFTVKARCHVPVMCAEMIEALVPQDDGIYFDGTVGAGGYTEALLQASGPSGRVIGVDMDETAIESCNRRFLEYGDRVRLFHAGYHEVGAVLTELGIRTIHGAVLDLGLSSDQLHDAARGFSFQTAGPLDMRFDTSSGESVSQYLERISTNELEEILATYGEERYCKKLARAISTEVQRGGLETTKDLVRIVERLLGTRRGKIHPATRVFQALRIAVNHEVENLRLGLERIPQCLGEGARFCVVSYHSLEDREVKVSFRTRARERGTWRVVTPKPWRPTAAEVLNNPRARSARMRVLEALVQEPVETPEP
jgi:16S rRNA (cytosine1402-N4)-methyltransferase